ncbi:V-type ATP synthase subunit C [Halopenitus persicus]|uniref:A-type ATP synthase subunit C n=1 Tax=Halopenitus persicus TaxID=1048396 RepID=A0A1H3G3A0_9EURY|nr:V-type ATP synthase subunit C [Halopenitus persicus]QHS16855.1 V-type ATP synthase subunit C [haloarchaeon 3A1-DGR]SDX96849.1 V/A-type H+-transporting ATPase subunit C [Halopenitus persicus]
MSAVGSSNPEYVVARVRARRGKLYSDEEYRKLTRMGPAEIARFMEESTYEAEINALGSRHGGVDLIEYALNRNLAKQFEGILDWSEGRLYDLIARYLRKFDARNVKTVIRGIYVDASTEEIEVDLIRAGEFDDRRIRRLLEAESIEGVIEVLDDTIYGPALEEAYPAYEESGILVPLENAVDRTFYDHLLSELGRDEPTRQYESFLTAEIDFRNARNALRLARSGADIDPAEYFIEGGDLFTRDTLARLARNLDELVEYIAESQYADDLGPALRELEEADSLIAFEHATDAALLAYGDQLGTIHPVSVTPVISYILAKEREVQNIRAIARGKEAGLSDAEIEEELVIL